ncbi:hypothetical protein PT276_06525 [Orbaceae bacterium ESL0721]|nr:hypothetical protein [Orbaceae bacterium ESL0721]
MTLCDLYAVNTLFKLKTTLVVDIISYMPFKDLAMIVVIGVACLILSQR